MDSENTPLLIFKPQIKLVETQLSPTLCTGMYKILELPPGQVESEI